MKSVFDKHSVAIARLSALALPLICTAQLMATLDVTIVNLALPAIQAEFTMSNASLAWVIDAYTLAYGGMHRDREHDHEERRLDRRMH
ncbi:hypothetical protein [Catellatospora methionotrophica]|uniref:hypothetical protein n=1 Tax=Catellatospora methionotrophica TaxID=121620 RepID=UPI003400E794